MIVRQKPTHFLVRDDRLDDPREREAQDQRPQDLPRHPESDAEGVCHPAPDRREHDHDFSRPSGRATKHTRGEYSSPRTREVLRRCFVSEGNSHVPVEKGKLVARARRIEGQAAGVVRMVENDRGCQEILQQIVALTSAAQELSILLMRDHMLARWQEGVNDGETLADELTGLVRRVVRR